MSLRLKTRCRYPGCGTATRGRYCDEHAAQQPAASRGPAAVRDYDRYWDRVTSVCRTLDCYLCQECLKLDRHTVSSIVDHIVPIDVRSEWRLEIGNTQV